MIWKGVHWGFMVMAMGLFGLSFISDPKWLVIFTSVVSGTSFTTAIYAPICSRFNETCKEWQRLHEITTRPPSL